MTSFFHSLLDTFETLAYALCLFKRNNKAIDDLQYRATYRRISIRLVVRFRQNIEEQLSNFEFGFERFWRNMVRRRFIRESGQKFTPEIGERSESVFKRLTTTPGTWYEFVAHGLVGAFRVRCVLQCEQNRPTESQQQGLPSKQINLQSSKYVEIIYSYKVE